jgi:rRNA-processing protein FCF1
LQFFVLTLRGRVCSFGIKAPYKLVSTSIAVIVGVSAMLIRPQLAVDWEFVQAALEGKVLLREQMPKLMQEERTTTFVTPCIRKELEALMKQNKFYLGAYQIITKRFEGGHEQKYLSCKHEGVLSASDCIKQHVGAEYGCICARAFSLLVLQATGTRTSCALELRTMSCGSGCAHNLAFLCKRVEPTRLPRVTSVCAQRVH